MVTLEARVAAGEAALAEAWDAWESARAARANQVPLFEWEAGLLHAGQELEKGRLPRPVGTDDPAMLLHGLHKATVEKKERELREAIGALNRHLETRRDWWRDWAGGLPADVLATIAGKVVAQTEAGWAAHLTPKERDSWYWPEKDIQEEMAKRKRDGNCLFVFAMVCKPWRKAQLKVGAPLRTRVESDVILPGSVALAKWALAEGCPRETYGGTMAVAAASFGHRELVQFLIREQGFTMDEGVMGWAARNGDLELVRWLRVRGCDWGAETCMHAGAAGRLGVLQWLRANGCPWDARMCGAAANGGHLKVLQWLRANSCPWNIFSAVAAAEELGYSDDFDLRGF